MFNLSKQRLTEEVFKLVFLHVGQPVKYLWKNKKIGNKVRPMYVYGVIADLKSTHGSEYVRVRVLKEDGFRAVLHYEGVRVKDLRPWKPRKRYVL